MDMPKKPDETISQNDISSLIEAASEKVTETFEPEETIEAEPVVSIPEETSSAKSPSFKDPTPVTLGNGTGNVGMNECYSVNIQRVLDISLPVTINFGSTERSLNEVLKLAPGILLELDKGAEDPVVLKVNNKAFAWGRVVDVDGYYGVEITEIMTQADRIVSLGGTL